MAKNLKRHQAKKSAGKVLFVAVEGKTEEDYFKALRAKHRIPNQRLIIHNVGNGPVSEVKRYLDGLPTNKEYKNLFSIIDCKWGVADTEWEHGWKGCASRPGENPKEGRTNIAWAISSASFERWLLLHFMPSPPTLNANGLAAELSKHLVGYSHQHKGLSRQHANLLMERTSVALVNAERIRQGGLDSDDAFTDVDLLVTQIVSMAPKAP